MADEQPVIDPIDPLVDPPLRTEAPADFTPKADRFLAALPAMVRQTNAAIAKMNSLATWVMNVAKAAAASAKASSDSAIASDTSAKQSSGFADTAKSARDSAQVSAQAAQAATGLPPDNRPGWVLRQKTDSSGGVEWWLPVISQVGDTIISAQAPDSTWIPTGGIYLQSLYPALFAKLGRVPDFRDDQISTFASDPINPYSIAASGSNLVMTGYAPNQNRTEVRVSSDNGATWVVSTTNITSYATAYGNNTFVVVGYSGGTVLVSTNNGFFTRYGISNEAWCSVAFGNNLFVAVGYTGARYAVSSDNGRNWTAGDLPNNQVCPKVVFVSGLFVAFSSTTPGVYFTSANGTSWTQRSLPSAVNIGNGEGVVAANGMLLILNQLSAYTTRDGINWTTASTNLPFVFDINYKLAAGDGVFLVHSPASVGKVFFSTNLLQWGSRSRVTVGNGQPTGPAVFANGFCFLTNAVNGVVYRLKPVSYGASQFYGTDPIQTPVGLAHFIKAAQ